MVFLLILLSSFAMYGSTDAGNKSTDTFSISYVEDFDPLKRDIQFVKIIEEDNNPPRRENGKLIYSKLNTVDKVIWKKREINQGVLPVGLKAKQKMITELASHPSIDEAFNELASVDKSFSLHPGSVAKIEKGVREAFDEKEKIFRGFLPFGSFSSAVSCKKKSTFLESVVDSPSKKIKVF